VVKGDNMTKTANLTQKLVEVQQLLKAPKDLENKFGGYKYRSAESILEAVKPLLHERGLYITITDEVINLGNRFYIQSTVLVGCQETGIFIDTAALAREAETKKGMDESQITGAASSYARKYALNGMFAIDDTKDADATNDHGKGPKTYSMSSDLTVDDYTPAKQLADFDKVMEAICLADNLDDFTKIWNDYGRRIVNGLKAVGNEKYKTVSEKYTERKQHFQEAR